MQKGGLGNLCLLCSEALFTWKYIGHILYPQPSVSQGIRFFAEKGSARFSHIEKYDIV